MRLQLTGLLPLPAAAQAQDRVDTRMEVYQDEAITVVAPAARASVALGEGCSLTGGYHLDAITAAPPSLVVDTVTTATTYEERSHTGDLALDYAPRPDRALTASLLGRTGNDYSVQDVSLGLRAEVFDRMVTLSAVSHLSYERTWTAGDAERVASTLGNSLDLAANLILEPRTLLDLVLTGQAAFCDAWLGCHANPYRYVGVQDPAAGMLVLAERHPDRRWRGAAAARLTQGIGMAASVRAAYRFYQDTWDVQGHTVETNLAWTPLDERGLLRLDLRGTRQTSASFYAPTYATEDGLEPAWRTADRELAGLWEGVVGGAAGWTLRNLGPFLEVDLTARLARMWFHYPDYPFLPERRAWLVGRGVDVRL